MALKLAWTHAHLYSNHSVRGWNPWVGPSLTSQTVPFPRGNLSTALGVRAVKGPETCSALSAGMGSRGKACAGRPGGQAVTEGHCSCGHEGLEFRGLAGLCY